MYFFESFKLFQWNFFFLSLDNTHEIVQINDATVSPTGKQNSQKPPPILHPLTSQILLVPCFPLLQPTPQSLIIHTWIWGLSISQSRKKGQIPKVLSGWSNIKYLDLLGSTLCLTINMLCSQQVICTGVGTWIASPLLSTSSNSC